ncbi:glycosyltransferase [Bryocella elongata]|uniref:glycosyltransferase n=1 Tax=Bryocella elongata TaxID=863522 RepID=UPI0013575CCC|nr:glycosyltransferase [Bryocella elongata]
MVIFRDRVELANLITNLAPFRCGDLEVIIIDGGSDEGSVELLEARSCEVDDWLSEPDESLYDAMNKGIARARGEFVLHINAGDRLLTVPYEALRAAARDTAAVAFRVENEGEGVVLPECGEPLKSRCSLHHQGTFYRRALHLGYDIRLRIVADFDHNQRMLLAGLKVELGQEVVSFHGAGGVSSSPEMLAEHFATVRKNFGWRQMVWARFAHTRFYKIAARAREVGLARTLRFTRRQLQRGPRGEPNL